MTVGSRQAVESWSKAALRELRDLARSGDLELREDESLARHTTFGVGGPTPLMLFPRHPADVRAVADWAGTRALDLLVLGGGSNLLVSDSGVGAPVIHTGGLSEGIVIEAPVANLPAGLGMSIALRRSIEAGLDGLVWATGLPGSVGGAAAGNAGCWGGDMAGATVYLDVVDAHGAADRLPAEELRWNYRSLQLPDRIAAPWMITAVGVRLDLGDAGVLRERYAELQTRKREQQPVGARNSGCIFRNPEGSSAGQILDTAGCKGMREGGAVVSDRHANFIINDRGAAAVDVERLIERLVSRAHTRAGVELVPEIRRW